MNLDDLMWLMMLLVAVTAMLIIPARRRDQRKNARPSDTPDELRELRSRASRAIDEAERLRLDMEEMHREVSARLDNKIRVLEQLVADADQRIAALRAASEGEAGGAP